MVKESAWCRGRLGGVCCYGNTECESSPVQSEGIGGMLVCKAIALKMGGMHGFVVSTGRFRSVRLLDSPFRLSLWLPFLSG